MAIQNLLGVRVDPAAHQTVAGQGDDNTTKNLFVTVQSLTFSGVTVIGGVLLNFVTSNIGGARLWVALGLALVLGVIVTIVAISTPNSSWSGAPSKVVGVLIAVVNTAVLWISLYGISSIPLSGSSGS